MAPQESWKKAGGFRIRRVYERPDALKIEIRHAVLFLKIFVVFILLLAVEYPLCDIYYRLVRRSDIFGLDLGCALAALVFCGWFSRKLILDALKEQIPVYIVVALFLIITALLGAFFRFSFQLANGLLDFSLPEVHRVTVTEKKVTVFGGSLQEGPNSEAHMVYFKDWDNGQGNCQVLLPPAAYYMVEQDGPLDIAVRPGFFHLAWLQAYQLILPKVQEDAAGN